MFQSLSHVFCLPELLVSASPSPRPPVHTSYVFRPHYAHAQLFLGRVLVEKEPSPKDGKLWNKPPTSSLSPESPRTALEKKTHSPPSSQPVRQDILSPSLSLSIKQIHTHVPNTKTGILVKYQSFKK